MMVTTGQYIWLPCVFLISEGIYFSVETKFLKRRSLRKLLTRGQSRGFRLKSSSRAKTLGNVCFYIFMYLEFQKQTYIFFSNFRFLELSDL